MFAIKIQLIKIQLAGGDRALSQASHAQIEPSLKAYHQPGLLVNTATYLACALHWPASMTL